MDIIRRKNAIKLHKLGSGLKIDSSACEEFEGVSKAAISTKV